MRLLLIILLLLPSLSYAIGEEECWFEGKIGKKKINLTYQDIAPYQAAWRSSKFKKYNYCRQSEKEDEIIVTDSSYRGDVFFLCYEKYAPKTKPTIVYKSVEHYYVCKIGCGANVSKKLTIGCVSY